MKTNAKFGKNISKCKSSKCIFSPCISFSKFLCSQEDILKNESGNWDSINKVQDLQDIVLVRLDTIVASFKDLFLQDPDASNTEVRNISCKA